MDSAIIQWLTQTLDASSVKNRTVLEVGARNINGTPREVILPMEPDKYIGMDIEDGPGVDLVIDAIEIPSFFTYKFDYVISCEALEHMRDWQRCFLAMASVAHTFILTTRSEPFGAHCMPHDYWRFSQETMIEIAHAAGLSVVECVRDWEYPGVFIKMINPSKNYIIEEHEHLLADLEHPPTPVLEG